MPVLWKDVGPLSVVLQMNIFLRKNMPDGQPHMLQILCSSVRVKLLAHAKLIFLREEPDDFSFCGKSWHVCGMFAK